MKKIASEERLCIICMEHHEVITVELMDEEIFKGEKVAFQATYEYCSNADEYAETEEMIRQNSLAMKDAYRQKVGLLTSKEIKAIREKYDISQKDLAEVLGWGRATINRYEKYQVQDRAHDHILRKIDSDPKWFLEMLEQARPRLTEKAYDKYAAEAKKYYTRSKTRYLIDTIHADYAVYEGQPCTGGVELDLDKVVEMINYLASKVCSLHKVKLMKMLWYADALHFKRTGRAISGLVYLALPMGAVPESHHHIISLEGVVFDEVEYNDNVGYRFTPVPGFMVQHLTESELRALDTVIAELGALNAKEISERMHGEEAYKLTPLRKPISYELAKSLSLN